MKYLYIAGLEHSGTTLLNQLLGADRMAVPVGEIFQFFSPEFMAGYLERWGDYEDAFQCACGQSWRECPFWGEIPAAIDYSNTLTQLERFQLLVDRVRSEYGEEAVIVDSSKSLPALNFIRDNLPALALDSEDLLVVMAVRDVRGFVTSQLAKHKTAERSLRGVHALMRLWLNENRRFLSILEDNEIPHLLSLYEDICSDGGMGISNRVHARGFPKLDPSLPRSDSHIALGNKNFLHRNSERIRYDSRWFLEDRINLVYQFYPTVRKFNRRLYGLVSQ